MSSRHDGQERETLFVAPAEDLAEFFALAAPRAALLPPRRTVARALEAGLEQIAQLPGARFPSIWLLKGDKLGLVASRLPTEYANAVAQIPLDAPFPAADAARTRRPVIVPIGETTGWQIGDQFVRWPQTGLLAGLPMTINAHVLGAIAYSTPPQAPACEHGERLALVVAGGIALAIDNARLYAVAARNQRELLGIIDSSPTGIIVVEGGPRLGRISLSNHNMQTLLGVPELVGLNIFDVLRSIPFRDEQGAPIPVEQWPLVRSLNGAVCTNVAMQVSREGKPPTWLLVDSVPLRDPQGNIVGAIATLEDISALKESQQRLLQYVSVIAHELRAPITVLAGFAQLLQRQRRDRPPGEVRAIEAIRFNVGRMEAMIRDLLEASRLQVHRARIEATMIELPPIVQRTIDGLRPVLGDHAVQVQVAANVPAVWADPARVTQITTNLLTNAAKYSPPGTPIIVRVEPTDDEARVSVTDRGPGIPESELPKLFEPFQQLERPGYPREGLGLGLYISRGLVEAQGGRIGVETRVGQGSTFWFTLPRAGRPRDQASAANAARQR